MAEDMSGWQPRPRPARSITLGRYVDLVPLNTDEHAQALFEASSVPDAHTRFTWLPEVPPATLNEFLVWVKESVASEDPLFFAVIDKASGKVAGRQTLMRIDADNGVVEIGNIYWGPMIARQRGATEALYLAAKYVFDELGYRRFEWKCNNDNAPSKNAALRFGFEHEGVFRQHLIVKGLSRDTAWFSIIDKDWPALRDSFKAWLQTDNFDAEGVQKKRLQDFR